jgi:hypothetical protein
MPVIRVPRPGVEITIIDRHGNRGVTNFYDGPEQPFPINDDDYDGSRIESIDGGRRKTKFSKRKSKRKTKRRR